MKEAFQHWKENEITKLMTQELTLAKEKITNDLITGCALNNPALYASMTGFIQACQSFLEFNPLNEEIHHDAEN
jgi:hypothetical protein